jgi:hypothetical protein
MSMTLNRATYERLIEEDITEIMKLPRTLERDHAIAVLRESVKLQYDQIPGTARRWVDSYGPDRA